MKAFLMFRNRDFDLKQPLPPSADYLVQDLELNTLFNAMSSGDAFIFDVSKKTVLLSLVYSDPILYRQEILKDCIKNPSTIRNIYALAIEGIESEKKTYFGFFNKYPDAILHSSIEVLNLFMGTLKKIRKIADEESDKFESNGFKRFFNMIKTELIDEYFEIIEDHLKELEFKSGMLIGADIGSGNKGKNYIILKPNEKKQNWLSHVFSKEEAYTFTISDRDERGAEALGHIKDMGTNLVANTVAQSADHILNFFGMLRNELAFYIGAVNLYEQLSKIDEPVCFPVPESSDERIHDFDELYDVSLALTKKQKVIGNTLNLDEKNTVIITGANQGGKSTFLKSIGQSQIMMQCGMFIAAKRFTANISNGIFTHFKREEDTKMNSGKFDEELKRMDEIVNNLKKNSIVLFNESFSATNEKEGSEIARQIVTALIEKNVKIFFVTHQYEFAHGLYEKKVDNIFFLKAERNADGSRSFKLSAGEPSQTSYGIDLYRKIFHEDLVQKI
jgi:DNA mismatch repair ATPase MutS